MRIPVGRINVADLYILRYLSCVSEGYYRLPCLTRTEIITIVYSRQYVLDRITKEVVLPHSVVLALLRAARPRAPWYSVVRDRACMGPYLQCRYSLHFVVPTLVRAV